MSSDNTSEISYIGKAIRQIRDSKRQSRDSLSLDAGVDISTIERLETGPSNPTINTIGRLAKNLGTDLKSLVLLGEELKMAEKPSLRETLAHNIRTARKYRGFTQQHLANTTNTTVSYISGLERGKIGASVDKISVLAHALDTNPGHLLFKDFATDVEFYMD